MKKLYTTAKFINKEKTANISDSKTQLAKPKQKFTPLLSILALLLLYCVGANATTYYSIATGNWNANTTWSLTSGGSAVGSGIYPIAGDNAIIQGGFTVTLSTNGTCASVQVGGTGTGILIFGSTSSLTFTTGNVTVNSGSKITSTTNGNQPHSFYISGNINCTGTWDMYGSNSVDDINVFLNGTTQTITGNGTYGWNTLTVESSSTTTVSSTNAQTVYGNLNIAGTFNLGTSRFNRSSSGGTLTVSGKMILGSNTGGQTGSNFPVNYSTINLANGTVEYNYAGAQTVYSVPTYTNVTLSGSGAKTTSSVKINGILSMEGTATATGVPTYGSAATLQYKGTNSYTTSNNEFPANFSGSGGVIIDQGAGNSVTLNGNKTGMAGDLNIKSGTLNLSTFTINRATAGGTLTIANGATLKIGGTNTFPSNYTTHNINCTSTTEYSGTSQTIANLNSSQSYGNLTLSGSGTKTLQTGTTAICNNFTITGTANTTGVTGLAIGGNVQIDATASFTAGAYEHTVGGNWIKTGTFNATGSTINFNGSISNQSIGASSFNNITFSNAATKTATGILTIAGDVTINSNFNTGNFNHSVAGNWTNNGTFTAGTGTITLNATGTKIIGGTTNSLFNNLIINETGSSTLGINTTVTGILTLTKGLLDIGTYTLTIGNISGGNSTSYVKTSSTGRLKRMVTTGGTVFLFPVGNSAYNPISFSSSAIGNGNSDYFSIRVEDGALTNANVNEKTVKRKWYLMCGTTGITSLTVAPSYNAGETGTLFNAALSPKIGFFTGTAWGYGPGTASGTGPYTVTAPGTAPDATSPEAFVAIGSEDAFSASKFSITVLPPTPYKGVNSSVATVQSQNSQGVPTWLLSTTAFDLTSNKSFTRVGGLTGFTINAGTHETIINNIEFLESTWNVGNSTYELTATVTAARTSGENLANGTTPAFAILDGSIYRPTASGDWSTTPWEKSSDGGTSWAPAALPTDNVFTGADVIQIPANITLTANVPVSFYSLLLFGTLDINSSGSLTVNHSASDANDYNIQVYGTLKNSGGTLINGNTNFISVNVNGGTYWHDMNGGSIPVANWNSLNGILSTCKVTGVTTTAITAGLDQNFQNFIWDNAAQNTTQTLTNDLIVRNTLTLANGVITTNDKKVVIELGGTTVSTNNSHINGNIRIHIPTTTSPTINFPIGDANYYTPLLVAFTGTIVGSGYLDAYTSATQPPLAAGLSQSKYINRIWTVSNTNISGFSSFNTTFAFADADKIGNPNTDALVVRKLDNNIWATTTVGARTANSTECRDMTSFSTFAVGEDDCTANNYIWLGGTSSDWNTASNWCYNKVPADTVNVTIPSGPANQPVIGAAGGSCKNLTILAGASLTITGSNALSLKGNLINSGTFNANSGTVSFTGTEAQTITGSATFNNLTINNAAGVTSASDLTVRGTLLLQSANASATTGALDMGSNTLNMGTNAITAGTGDVTGIVRRQQTFVGNTAYSFGNPNTNITFTDFPGTTKPTWIICKIVIGSAPSWRTTAVKRYYTFAIDGGNDRTAIRLHYLDSELDASEPDETELVLWDAHNGDPWSVNHAHGKSNFSSTDNWIGLTGISIQYIAPASIIDNKQWGLAYSNVPKKIWLGIGADPGDWSLPDNWNGGVPTLDDAVLIPAGCPSYPTKNLNPISYPAVAKTIEIENGASLTVDNYDITVSGAAGAWLNNGTFVPGTGKVTFNHNNAADYVTIGGINNFYNLEIGSYTVIRPNNGSYISISGTLYTDPASVLELTTTSNTFEFKGGSTTLLNPIGIGGKLGYQNLILNNSGTVTFPTQLNVSGDLTVNVATDGTTNNSTLILNGNAVQTISGSNALSLQNLTINNVAGIIGSTNMTVNGALVFVSDNPASNDKGALAMSENIILDMGVNSTTSGPGDVSGIIRRNHNFETSTYYSFGNADNGLTFAAVTGTPGQVLPTSVSLKVNIGTAPNWSAYSGTAPTNPIRRSFEIIQSGGSGTRAIMQVHYRDNEVPTGVSEDQLTIWTSSYNSGTFYNKEAGRSNYNSTDNFVSIQDVNFNIIPSNWGEFKATIAPTATTNYTWIGTQSSSWTNSSNWSPNGVPNSTTGAIIPNTYTTPYVPKLVSTSCKSILIKTGGVLNAPDAGGTFLLTGANNAWTVEPGGVFNPNTSTIAFTAIAATDGNTSIVGNTHFYNITIGNNSLLRPATDSYINISGLLANNGVLDAATNENTIEFSGTDQSILNPNGSTPGYHNLLLSGSGIKTLPSTLNITDEFTNNADSVNANSGTVLFSGNPLYGQKISGSKLTWFNNLTVDNPSQTVSVLSDIAVNGTLTVSNGTILNMGTSSLRGSVPTISGTGSIYTQSTSSAPLPSGKTWTGPVIYNGTIPQTAVAGTYNNLTISNASGCTANGDITINQNINLAANNPSATNGLLELVSDWQAYPSTGYATPESITSHTLYMGASATTTGPGDVTGIIKRNYTVDANRSYTFGNEFTTLALSPGVSPVMPSSITVVCKIGSTPAGKDNAIQRSYQIIPASNGANCFVSGNFHYLDSELQSSISPYFQNSESKLATWDYDIDGGFATPDEHGRAAYDFSNNFVGLSNVPVSYFIYNESSNNWRTIFTLGDRSDTNTLTWSGTTDSDWNNGSNWIPSGSAPTSTTFVVIPDANTTTHSPQLPTGKTSVNTLTIENGGILTMGADTLIIENTMSGGWEDQNPNGNNPGSSTVIFANSGATVSGTASFYNLTINNGATLTNAANSIVKVSGTVTNNGAWYTDDSNNTVEYNGAAEQTVVLPAENTNYNNLTLSGNGSVNLPATPLNIDGNLTIGSNVTTVIDRDLTIKGDIINNSSNFTNTAGTITLNGTKNQSIGGAGTINFNNLSIDNAGYTVTATTSFGVANTLSLGTGAILNMGTQALTSIGSNSGAGSITTQNTGSAPLPSGAVWSSKIIYNNQTAIQNVVAGTYNALQISNPVGTNATGDISTTTLTIDNRSILDMGTNALTGITTNFGTGTLRTQNSGSTPIPAGKTWTSGIVYNAAVAQTAVGGTFNTLTIDNAAGVNLADQANVSIQSLLLINNSKKLVIPTQTSMNAQSISNNAGTQGITIKSSDTAPNGSLTFYNTPSFPVSATVEMYTKAAAKTYDAATGKYSDYKWEYFGIPLQSVSADPTFYGSYIRKYNESTVPARWENLVNSSVLTPFTGYEITQPTAKTIYFKGQLVNSSVTKNLQYTSGVQYAGQNILSNPFTAGIDIAKLNFGAGTDATIYLYNTGSFADWQTAGGANGDTPGQYSSIPKFAAEGRYEDFQWQIPSMQGFMVVTTNNSTLEIPYSAVITKNSFLQKARSTNTSSSVYTKITVTGTRYSDKMWIITNPDCTHRYDNGWDGKKLLGSSTTPQIWAMEPEGDYQVSGVDNINNTQLAFMNGKDSIYTLTFTHENSVSAYPGLYLVDLKSNNITDITASGTQYTFNSNQTSIPTTARFKIVTSPGMITGNDDLSSKLKISSSDKTVYIENNTGAKGDLLIYDVLGKYIQKYTFNANGQTIINTDLTTGVYLLRTTTSNNENIQRVIIH